jgi:hypothetical protein
MQKQVFIDFAEFRGGYSGLHRDFINKITTVRLIFVLSLPAAGGPNGTIEKSLLFVLPIFSPYGTVPLGTEYR